MISAPTSAFSLTGKTILVTHADSEVGSEVAMQCSLRGARMLLVGDNNSTLQKLRDTLPSHEHLFVARHNLLRVGLPDSLPTNSSIHGVVHCHPPATPNERFIDLSDAHMHARCEEDFLAPVRLTQYLLQNEWLSSKSAVVFLLSISAHKGVVGANVQAAMQAALVEMSKCLALELANQKIRVNSVASPLLGRIAGQPDSQTILGPGSLQDVANAAIYLLSDASRWVTGTSLIVDGGETF